MISTKNILLLALAALLVACGQTESSPSKVKAESILTSSVRPTEEKQPIAQKVDLKSAEHELKKKSMDEADLEEESENTVPENIENPRPVKVKQVIEPKKEVKIEKPVVEEPVVEKPTLKEPEKETPKEKVTTPITPKKEVVVEEKLIFSHDAFNQLLKNNVSASGKVNYNNLKASEAKLDAYLKALDENPPASGWSRNKKMAYWINAYNAATIKLILKNYPVSSITKLHGGKPWDQKWIPLGGKTYTLNNIENDILRPVYKDARIHFAVNCAAKSCPPLLNRAWTEGNLNKYLEQQTKSFINDPAQNTIAADAVEISKIFEWYVGDFGNIIEYLNKYSTTKINANAKVTYKEYDWALNK